ARCSACGRRVPLGGACPIGHAGDGPGEARSVPSSTRTSDPPDPPEVPGWRIAGLLGAGGHGAGWGAVAATGRRAAIKVAHRAHAAAAARLEREADALRRLGPSGGAAAGLLEVGRLADGTPWLAMERIDAPTLAQVLADHAGGFPLPGAGLVARGLVS